MRAHGLVQRARQRHLPPAPELRALAEEQLLGVGGTSSHAAIRSLAIRNAASVSAIRSARSSSHRGSVDASHSMSS